MPRRGKLLHSNYGLGRRVVAEKSGAFEDFFGALSGRNFASSGFIVRSW
jgi:hypothetical protein